MDSELHYLDKRIKFHRRMARLAAGDAARWAHNAFVLAYEARAKEEASIALPAPPNGEPGVDQGHDLIRPLAVPE